MEDISIAIITRNNSKKLKRCLDRLFTDTKTSPKIIVIDNFSSDNTKEIIDQFKQKLQISYYVEKKIGYGFARNKALAVCKTKWIIFIDDDCLITHTWFSTIKKAIHKKSSQEIAAFQGLSQNSNSTNIFGVISQIGIDSWIQQHLNSNGECVHYSLLNTRNVCLNRNLLGANKLRFIEQETGGEDTKLGFDLEKKKLKLILLPDWIVFHDEPDSLKAFIKKKIQYCLSEKKLPNELIQIQKLSREEQNKIIFANTKHLTKINRLIVWAIYKLEGKIVPTIVYYYLCLTKSSRKT